MKWRTSCTCCAWCAPLASVGAAKSTWRLLPQLLSVSSPFLQLSCLLLLLLVVLRRQPWLGVTALGGGSAGCAASRAPAPAAHSLHFNFMRATLLDPQHLGRRQPQKPVGCCSPHQPSGGMLHV